MYGSSVAMRNCNVEDWRRIEYRVVECPVEEV